MLQYDTLFGIPIIFIGLGCFVIAAIFFFVWPRSKAKPYKQISWPHYILHYFHALAWILLGLAIVFLASAPIVAILLFVLGLAAYALFISMLVRAWRPPQ
jgi:hypothetical protein